MELLKWYGQEALAKIEGVTWRGIQRAVEFFVARLQDELNVPAIREKKTRTRDTSAGPKGSQYTVYHGSAPGEPPRKRTGNLQKAIAREYDEANMKARVGIRLSAFYGLFLELGTKVMAARPFFLATLRKYWNQIVALMHLD